MSSTAPSSDRMWRLGTGEPGLVTVVITAFNQDWILSETLTSVAAQTYRPLECVIVNDGSTDDTASIIRNFASQHSGDLIVKPVWQEHLGAQAARNNGIATSSGEF